MPKLHTLNKPASQTELMRQLSETIREDDSVLLIEDGVYHILDLEQAPTKDSWQNKAKKIFALKDDALSRGVPTSNPTVSFISYSEFVEQSAQHSNVISWY